MQKTISTKAYVSNEYTEWPADIIALTLNENTLKSLENGYHFLTSQEGDENASFNEITINRYAGYHFFTDENQIVDASSFNPCISIGVTKCGSFQVGMTTSDPGSAYCDELQFKPILRQFYDEDPKAWVDIEIINPEEPESPIFAKLNIFSGFAKDISDVDFNFDDYDHYDFHLASNEKLTGVFGYGEDQENGFFFCSDKDMTAIQRTLIYQADLIYQIYAQGLPGGMYEKFTDTLAAIYHQESIELTSSWLENFIVGHNAEFLKTHSFNDCLTLAERHGFTFNPETDYIALLAHNTRLRTTTPSNDLVDAYKNFFITLIDRGCTVNLGGFPSVIRKPEVHHLIESILLEKSINDQNIHQSDSLTL